MARNLRVLLYTRKPSVADLGPSSRYIQFSDLTENFCVMKHLIFLFEGELDRFFSNIRKPLSDSLHGKNHFVYEYPSVRDIPSFKLQ